MAQSIKDIHICNSLEELQQNAKVASVENASVKLLLRSAELLYAEAEKNELYGDEERTYLYFYRYLDAVITARTRDEYKKDKELYHRLIPSQKILTAISTLEKLTESLPNRYALKIGDEMQKEDNTCQVCESD